VNPLKPENIETFLSRYWQKKPLFIPAAFNNFKSPLSADELAGLACEEGVNARLVLEHAGTDTQHSPWSVEYGPFDEERFARLPESNWSLLVSDIENLLPEAAEIIRKFRFIPDWRIDDLMISYAPPGGSVGPHTDAYDVFLIQLTGQRQWQISEHYDNTLLEHTELSILQGFNAEHSWTMNPGDMLYLPPNVAHHGIALKDCMTASVGFRAPALNAMAHDYADSIASKIDDTELYTDASLKQQTHPAEISADAIEKIRNILTEKLRPTEESVRTWLGEYVSELHCNRLDPPPQPFTRFAEFKQALKNHRLYPATGSRFLFSRLPDSGADEHNVLLFVDGQSYLAPSIEFITALCDPEINQERLLELSNSDVSQQLLLKLYNRGALTITRQPD